MLTNFQNSFTARKDEVCKKTCLQISTKLKGVATLPCEMKTFENSINKNKILSH